MELTKAQQAAQLREQKKSESEAAKKARELAKSEKELRKANVQIARTQRELAKLEQAAAKRKTARRWLPDSYPDWEQSKDLETPLRLDGFFHVRDNLLFEKISSALQSSTIAKVFDSIADVFDCDKSEICLLEGREIMRKGKKTPVVYFRYPYNQIFNNVLKSERQAVFDGNIKAWNLVLDDDAKSVVSDHIGKFYRVVIDLGSMTILKNEVAPQNAAQTLIAFNKLPFHIPIKKLDVLEAILSSRPFDKIREDHVHINDGNGFVPYPEQETIWTQSPFLLFRYAVLGGNPRYVSFSTLGIAVEGISFGNKDKKTSMAIARFMDTCHVLKLAAFEPDCSKLLLKEPHPEITGDVQSNIPDLGMFEASRGVHQR